VKQDQRACVQDHIASLTDVEKQEGCNRTQFLSSSLDIHGREEMPVNLQLVQAWALNVQVVNEKLSTIAYD
jgi:hypothetical protein